MIENKNMIGIAKIHQILVDHMDYESPEETLELISDIVDEVVKHERDRWFSLTPGSVEKTITRMLAGRSE